MKILIDEKKWSSCKVEFRSNFLSVFEAENSCKKYCSIIMIFYKNAAHYTKP